MKWTGRGWIIFSVVVVGVAGSQVSRWRRIVAGTIAAVSAVFRLPSNRCGRLPTRLAGSAGFA